MFWRVTSTIVYEDDNGRKTVQVPTFILDGNHLGIVHAHHAEQIARRVIDPDQRHETHVNVLALSLSDME